jgi:GNAT superfamily N-acetyltransferase
MDFSIEEVHDLEAAWADIEPLLRGLNDNGAFHDAPLLADWAQRQRQRLLTGEHGIIVLARRDGRAVGLMNGRKMQNPSIREEAYCYVDFAFVTPDLRGFNIGGALFDRVEAWTQKQGLSQVHLTVIAANDGGVRFWERAGFAVRTYGMTKTLRAA